MHETLIPWDFLGMLVGILVVMMMVVGCLYALKARRRARLVNPA